MKRAIKENEDIRAQRDAEIDRLNLLEARSLTMEDSPDSAPQPCSRRSSVGPSQVDGMEDPSIVAVQRSPETSRVQVDVHSSTGARNKKSSESGYYSNSPSWSGNLKEAFLPTKDRKATPYPEPQPRPKAPGNNPFRSQALGMDETPRVRDPGYFRDLAPAGATSRASEPPKDDSMADMMGSPEFRAGYDKLVRAHQVKTTDI